MNFLFPLFLIASVALAIPILIHLFNFRKFKKVYFPDIRFLKELQEQTQKHSKLKHRLILASRLLAVLSLVFAFAQPFFSKDKEKITQGNKAVSIYIDNSFSMGVEKNKISLFDLAKGKAKEIIETYSNNDVFQLLISGCGYDENEFLTKQEALQQLGLLQLSTKTKKADIILEKQKQLLNTEHGFKKQIVFISDFQKNNFSNALEVQDSIAKYFIPIYATETNNISLDSIYFENPSILLNEPNKIVVKIKNNSSANNTTALTLLDNNQLKSVVNIDLKANEQKNIPIEFTTSSAGNHQLSVSLQDNPVQFDDTFFVSGKVSANYAVLVLNQQNANAFLSSVFKPNAQFKVDNNNINSVNLTTIKNYSLIVLNGILSINDNVKNTLTEYVNKGGNLLVFAPQQNNVNTINTFLQNTAGCSYAHYDTSKKYITNYNKSHAIFKDIFVKTPENIEMPIAFKHYLINKNSLSNEQKLFSYSNGESFLSSFKVGNGTMYICASSAESNASSFPKSYWFLPMLFKMAYSNNHYAVNAITIGKNNALLIDNDNINDKTVYHVSQKNVDAIPEQRSLGNKVQLNFNESIHIAGNYAIYTAGSKDTTFVGINYDRTESKMEFWNINELKNNTKIKNATWLEENKNVGSEINELQHGMPLWKVCIILALLFLLIEILLIRLLK